MRAILDLYFETAGDKNADRTVKKCWREVYQIMSAQYVCGNNTKVFVCNDQVSVCLSETEIALSEAEKSTMRNDWKEAVDKNPNLFDGVVLSVKSVEKLSYEHMILVKV